MPSIVGAATASWFIVAIAPRGSLGQKPRAVTTIAPLAADDDEDLPTPCHHYQVAFIYGACL